MQSKSNNIGSVAADDVQGVNATSTGLIRATIGSALVAGAILLFAWLPAEYGIDPTGVGHVLGLTEMGHIKEQLHAEADADAVAAKNAAIAQTSVAGSSASMTQASQTVHAQPVVLSNADITMRLDDIQLQLATIEKKLDAAALTVGAQASVIPSTEHTPSTLVWKDEVAYTLEPGEGVEVKLKMDSGAVAEFEWTANGAVLNHDTHGDGGGQNISYEKGRAIPEQAGQLVAAFTGNHGWFWRNRTNENVVLTMRARGDYNGLVLPD